MRTHLLLGACVCAIFGRTLNAQRNTSARTPVATQAQEYAGVYQSTPEEDYFTPCGIDGVGDTWSLRFRENDSHAPFLKKVTASRGYTPLTHFIRIRGRLSE